MSINYKDFLNAELNRPDWSNLAVAGGNASKIPSFLKELLSATSPEEAARSYWKLEGRLFVSGHLYESSLYTVPILLSSLIDHKMPGYVKEQVLELLFQIGNGYILQEDEDNGLANLEEQCKDAIRSGLWLLYFVYFSEIDEGMSEQVSDVILLVEPDPERRTFLKAGSLPKP